MCAQEYQQKSSLGTLHKFLESDVYNISFHPTHRFTLIHPFALRQRKNPSKATQRTMARRHSTSAPLPVDLPFSLRHSGLLQPVHVVWEILLFLPLILISSGIVATIIVCPLEVLEKLLEAGMWVICSLASTFVLGAIAGAVVGLGVGVVLGDRSAKVGADELPQMKLGEGVCGECFPGIVSRRFR